LAPNIIGKGLNIAEFGPLLNLNQSIPLKFISTEFIGTDIKVVARVIGSEDF
jgi:diaminohydroxyphosphoribosylaminopyrimidine deaminase/5-amino-6-(5-phosphoribosylamino)uracil reductase